MLNKLDKKLQGKIKVQSINNENVEVIILLKNYDLKKKLISYSINNKIIELPMINSIAMTTKTKNLINLSNENFIEYVSSNSKVCGLIFESKKTMGVNKLYPEINPKNNHTCVVIDTGIYPHIDFCLGKNRIIKFVDLINQSNSPYDDNGHGTFVSGILCGNSITDKYTGIDNTSDIIVIKALDKDGETSSVKILEAMQWVLDNRDTYNIKVVCMSFGSQINEVQDPLIIGAEELWDNGIVVVSAGGNSGPESSTIMSPGASRKIITVGSLHKKEDGQFEVADFSSRGPALGFFKPDMIVPGVDIISTNLFTDGNKFYTNMTGTSVSTPMVAGVVSLLYKINPNYTPNQIKYMLINSCISLTGDRNSEGFGRLDLRYINLL